MIENMQFVAPKIAIFDIQFLKNKQKAGSKAIASQTI